MRLTFFCKCAEKIYNQLKDASQIETTGVYIVFSQPPKLLGLRFHLLVS